jgi:hypothetical protein
MQRSQCLAIVKPAAEFLMAQIAARGKFVYERDVHNQAITGKYNMLRHCGAIWSLALYEQFCGKKTSSAALLSAVDYAKNKVVRCIFGEEQQQVLLLLDKGQAKLGGNALAVLALNVIMPRQAEVLTGLIAGMGCFLEPGTAAVKFSKFNPQTGYVSDFSSEYYPGEAALAFALTGHHVTALRLVAQLRQQRDKEKVLQDHWLMQAIEVLDTHAGGLSVAGVPAREFLRSYAREIYQQIVDDPYYLERSTPLACRAEALVAYLGLLARDPQARLEEHFAEVKDFCHFLLLELRQHQMRKGPLTGAFVEGKRTRIDYTQHAMTAYLRYVMLKDELRSLDVVL